MRTIVLLLATLAVAGLLAGCFDESAAPAAEGFPADAPAEAGDGAFALAIHVTDEPGGPAVAGAEIAIFDGERLLHALRSDARGMALARVAPDSMLRVVARADGSTQELHDVVTGAAGERQLLDVPLYREIVRFEINGTLGPADASLHRAGLGEFRWDPQDVQWGRTPDARAGYQQRLVALRVTLAWDNGPTTGVGDLGIGAGARGASADFVQDSGDAQATPGGHEEELFLGFGPIHDLGWREAGETLKIGAGTGSGYAAPLGMPYTLSVEAHFDGDLDKDVPIPGLPLAGAIGACLAALALRRP